MTGRRRAATPIPAPTSPVTWLLAADCSATAVHEPLVDAAKPWNRPEATFAGADADHLLVGIDLVTPAKRAKLDDIAILS